MTPTEIKQQLINSSENPQSMKEAIQAGIFYVVAVKCSISYSIGCLDNDVPALYATKHAADKDNDEQIENYNQEIIEGDRDKLDEWEGRVLEARWNCESESMSLYDEGQLICTDSWISLSGL